MVNLLLYYSIKGYQAINIATTNLSDVRKRTGWPIRMDATVVPPLNYSIMIEEYRTGR